MLVWRRRPESATRARVWCQPYTLIGTPQQDFCEANENAYRLRNAPIKPRTGKRHTYFYEQI